MYNPEILATLDTQETRRRQIKQKSITKKTKKISNTAPTNKDIERRQRKVIWLYWHGMLCDVIIIRGMLSFVDDIKTW